MGQHPIDVDRRSDGRGKGALRLPGETRVEMCRRLGTYEHWRERFLRWIIEEGRTQAWIAEMAGYSQATVQVIAQSLDIYSRTPRTAATRLRTAHYVAPLGEIRKGHHGPLSWFQARHGEPPPPSRTQRQRPVPKKFREISELEKWHDGELAFQRMRLAYCSAWDRGW